jgi:hypothetical protein
MKAIYNLIDLVNAGDTYVIDDKISDLNCTMSVYLETNDFKYNRDIEKMRYQIAVFEDVKKKIISLSIY